jgi:hypothetical protein
VVETHFQSDLGRLGRLPIRPLRPERRPVELREGASHSRSCPGPRDRNASGVSRERSRPLGGESCFQAEGSRSPTLPARAPSSEVHFHAGRSRSRATGVRPHAGRTRFLVTGVRPHAGRTRFLVTGVRPHAGRTRSLATGVRAHAGRSRPLVTGVRAHAGGSRFLVTGVRPHAGGSRSHRGASGFRTRECREPAGISGSPLEAPAPPRCPPAHPR